MSKIESLVSSYLVFDSNDFDFDTLRALKAEFTHDNPKYSENERMGFSTWNIARQYASYLTHDNMIYFPRGAKDRVDKICNDNGYDVEFTDATVFKDRRPIKIKRELRPEQKRAVEAMVKNKNCVIRGPCGSGKTVMLLAAVAEIGQPTLIIVHTKQLMQQWQSMVSAWLGVVPGSIGGGRVEEIRQITVGMQQTIYRRAEDRRIVEKLKDYFGCIIGDEVHHWSASSFQKTAAIFPAHYRIGASADERRKDKQQHLIYNTFGPCVYEIKRQQQVEDGRLMPVTMKLVSTNFTDDDYVFCLENNESPHWQGLISNMNNDEERNDLIVFNAIDVLKANKNHRILILNDRVNACRHLCEMINTHQFCKGKKLAGLLLGGVSNKERTQKTISGLLTGRNRVGVGTSIADEGLDIPPLTHVFITSPSHTNLKRLVQRIGRVARIYPGKESANAFYFWDWRIFPGEQRHYENVFQYENRKANLFAKLKSTCHELIL